VTYLSDPAKWPALAAALRKAGEFGLDTETYGQPDRTSPQHRARVQCFSLGLLTGERSPRGFARAVGVVLPVAALECVDLRAVLEDSAITKFGHNSSHDEHSLRNEGVRIRMQDTLQWLRVACPGEARGYGLKEAEQWALGYGPRPGFLDMVGTTAVIRGSRARGFKGCICGANPCRARSSTDFLSDDGVWRPHIRVTWKVFSPTERTVPARYDIREFVPGHERWDAWIAYSLADAVRGIELVSWIRNRKQRQVAYPWHSASTTPPTASPALATSEPSDA